MCQSNSWQNIVILAVGATASIGILLMTLGKLGKPDRLVEVESRPRDWQYCCQLPQMVGVSNDTLYVFAMHTLHKAGSSIAANMFLHTCFWRDAHMFSRGNGVPEWDLDLIPTDWDREKDPVKRFQGHPLKYAMNKTRPSDRFICVGPIRNFDLTGVEEQDLKSFLPEGQKHRIVKLRRLLVIRHPLDMLVSAYFSFGWLHNGGMGDASIRAQTLDNYTLSYSDDLKPVLSQMPAMLRAESTCVLTYDHMVLATKSWMQELMCGMDLPSGMDEVLAHTLQGSKMIHTAEAALSQTVAKYGHTRRVIPGDYRVQLQEATQKVLLEKLKNEVKLFDTINFNGQVKLENLLATLPIKDVVNYTSYRDHGHK